MVCIEIFPLTLNKVLAVIALVVVIYVSWNTLDRIKRRLDHLLLGIRFKALLKESSNDEREAEIAQRVEEARELIERQAALATGDARKIQQHWRKWGIGE